MFLWPLFSWSWCNILLAPWSDMTIESSNIIVLAPIVAPLYLIYWNFFVRFVISFLSVFFFFFRFLFQSSDSSVLKICLWAKPGIRLWRKDPIEGHDLGMMLDACGVWLACLISAGAIQLRSYFQTKGMKAIDILVLNLFLSSAYW